ncbi:MAG: sulfatase-like hydrolase/transferase, partial [Planctomycetaceae bacterium]|nr:sulfatase-like hydrolase/transferase [Planctomycetaceae bacterium]
MRRIALLLLLVVLPRVARTAERPNVLVILSDDQAWTDYGFMGHDTIKTPHLDQLAAQSAVFPRGYVPASLCRPSLATLITGLYPHQHRISGNDPVFDAPRGTPKYKAEEYLRLNQRLIEHIEEHPTVPRLLGAQGYKSLQTGKWWEGHHSRGGFTSGMTHGDPDRGGRHGDAGLTIGREGLQPIYDFIEETGETPWFIWYGAFLPHSPHNPPERLLAKYTAPGKSIHVARYQAMCEWWDETCGELLDHLDQKELADNTLVVYVCDNGWIQKEDGPQYAPRSKRSPNEGGVRTPIMLRWPGHIQPAKYETLVSSIDLTPTMLAAAGVETPANLPGLNLLDVCEQGGKCDRHQLFGEIFEHDITDVDDPAKSLMYRWTIDGDWKLILPHGQGTAELYNLADDPHEN